MHARLFLGTFLLAALLLNSCGSSKTANPNGETLQQNLDRQNSAVIPLLTRIRRIPGIALENGVPVFVKSNNALQSGRTGEPLYVLDGLIIGSSYRQVKDIVNPVDVESVKGLSGADAAFYGSRGSAGVILITTRKGN
ncbi:TonB-dependent receptor plug domain-containing protein [Robiginitalea sp. M366]|uniref:TonB-dependent receptor plug domain-containing protein n=1 Tax=Robiginitalea aestuariiviva TaxID=3036903 RepID=UPI00240E4F3D|nr:TonB-dependent receptor plug domain-containing protein [Robiginitalea aestuariiviva]MDG1571284.1 TonB-dependent receptor plug domain-containing protein [Robiginitalea aestuariiviva]